MTSTGRRSLGLASTALGSGSSLALPSPGVSMTFDWSAGAVW
jgi:hypothetical protein